MRNASTLAIWSLLVAFGGCGPDDGLERVVVAGRVSYKGQPVEYGQLRFRPQSDTEGPVTIAAVREGRYLADSQGGVPVGEHRVEILAYNLKAVGGNWPTGPGANPPPQVLPSRYNKQSELRAMVPPKAETLNIDFDLAQ